MSRLSPAALSIANRFEAVAADAMDGAPYEGAVDALVREVQAGTLAGDVRDALRLMAGWIEDSDDSGRFAVKVAILRDAASRL
ncbi:hypothetical protein M2352_001277 [Azospirillum fermentarium]|uniref:hypothetical protein n=1 Tax=Azospirillum fermentarium TaxID=1233114 RepID=UPI002225FF09|nr:hypothetical protein [Azospirillum fermentarium]MCW2245686.1 hypothetical protein [Azospirillum fermentarium]